MPVPDSVILDPQRLRAVRRLGILDSALHEPLDRITERAASALDVPVSVLSLIDGEHQVFVGAHGLPPTIGDRFSTPWRASICQLTVASGEPVRIPDLRTDPRVPPVTALHAFGIVAYLGVPLRLREGDVVGSLCVVDHRRREWSEVEVKVLTELAGELAGQLALRSAVLQRVLEDPVTGVPGETLFRARCEPRDGDEPDPAALVCLRLDPGIAADRRDVRDRVLRAVAERLGASVRSTDVVGRLAGDVLGVLVPGVGDGAQALSLALDLRAAVTADPVRVDGEAVTVAVTVGVTLREPVDHAVDLVGRGERALELAAGQRVGMAGIVTHET